jgi:hypothetical protein
VEGRKRGGGERNEQVTQKARRDLALCAPETNLVGGSESERREGRKETYSTVYQGTGTGTAIDPDMDIDGDTDTDNHSSSTIFYKPSTSRISTDLSFHFISSLISTGNHCSH